MLQLMWVITTAEPTKARLILEVWRYQEYLLVLVLDETCDLVIPLIKRESMVWISWVEYLHNILFNKMQ